MLFHIAEQNAWAIAIDSGVYRPDSFEREGFIHCSTRNQVLTTARRFFAGRRDLILVVIDESLVEGILRYEPADGQMFPHIYGPLKTEAVIRATAFAPGEEGHFPLPAE